jgi:hypothetical protein
VAVRLLLLVVLVVVVDSDLAQEAQVAEPQVRDLMVVMQTPTTQAAAVADLLAVVALVTLMEALRTLAVAVPQLI